MPPPILDLPDFPQKPSLATLKCTIPKIEAIKDLERCLTDERRNNNCEDHAFNARKALENSGYRPLGSGIHRVGFAKRGEKCVIKLAKNRKGAIANMNEVNVWKDVSTSDVAKFFAPILKSGKHGSFVIMQRVNTRKEVPHRERKKLSEMLQKKGGIYCTDLNEDNVGTDDKGNPVIIDYGFGLNCNRYETGIMPGNYEEEYPSYPSRPSQGFPEN